ncbi:TonB-dependent receptor [Arcticibacter tournemirensis]
MPIKKKFSVLWTILSLYSVAIAQTGVVMQGRILDSDGAPVGSATIELIKLPDSVRVKTVNSNELGVFEFRNVSAGTYVLIAGCLGYRRNISGPYTVKPAGNIPAGNIKLMKDSLLLNEVEVKSEGAYIERVAGKVILNVDKSLMASGSNAFDILRRVPGILAAADGQISMRGRQGITIMMDGKAVSLSSGDLAEFLRGISADLVDQIELISNPSSSYDAGGGGGIINIKLKKNKKTGTNGSVTGGGGFGENYKSNLALLLNHRQKYFNVYGSWALNDYRRTDRYQMNRTVFFEERGAGFDINNYDLKSFSNQNFKAGADFFISKNQTFGLMYTGMHNHMFSDEENRTLVSNQRSVDSTIRTFSKESRTVSNNAFNLNYKLNFKSSAITVDADYLVYDRESDETLAYYFYNDHNELYRESPGLKNLTPSHITIRSLKADYSVSTSDRSTLQFGAKSSIVENNNKRRIVNVDDTGWLASSFVNDESSFKESIQAAYGNYTQQFKKAKLEIGLRGEYTQSSGSSLLGSNLGRNYFNLFPSSSFSFNLNKKHKLVLGYSRRITRPAYDDLNPFRYFLDQYTYREGNPYLRPEYSTSAELTDIYKERLTSNLSYNYVRDYYLSFTEQNDTSGVSRTIKRNLQSLKSIGMEFDYSLDVNSWFNSILNLQGYFRKFNIGQGESVQRNSILVSFSASNTFKLKKGVRAECNFSYESPTVSGMYDFKSVYVLDFGAGKAFLNDDLMLKLSVSDILNSDRNRYASNFPDVEMTGRQKIETRVVRLNLTYKFGRKTVGGSKSRKTGNEAESKRVNN